VVEDLVVIDAIEAEEPADSGFENLKVCVDQEGMREMEKQTVVKCVDAHFHVDRLARRLGVNSLNEGELIKMAQPKHLQLLAEEGSDQSCCGVANFVDPVSYPSTEDIETLRAHGCYVMVGNHPTKVSQLTGTNLSRLTSLLSVPEVSGLGEVGLDYQTPSSSWPEQNYVLCQCLQMLEERHVLVLHCRGQSMDPLDCSNAYVDLLYILKGIIPSSAVTQLHCFTGTQADVERYLKHFPNTLLQLC
jgi:Tat protein secretion system quality control protein TatD with DNase activity